MKNSFAEGCCGMSLRSGSIVAGLYMIVVCAIYSVFESGHLQKAYYTINITENAEVRAKLSVVLVYYYTSLALVGITFVVCVLLIVSAFLKLVAGLIGVITWIIIYEILNVILLALTSSTMYVANFKLRPIEWFGLSARLISDIFWLIFIVSYTLEVYSGIKTPNSPETEKMQMLEKNKTPLSSYNRVCETAV
ncbi:transmembrane protein 217 [Protopterus annectens]|uniref:transmembrane protein 217 n=1 Tax=Protopterus annectens TaxID=7888 RepID=UPI001CFB7D60|nr:transmembrane protein 217 [Protopterus annectens]